ncbi:MAG: AbrB/MazE/SpoVT family DNA-binding domain-containing protein, partial [Cyanobacteria bacterium J06629_2]
VKLKITKIGDSLGVGLTPEILEEMNVGEGDTLYVTQTDNGIYLTPHDPEFKEVMETAQDITQRYSQAMKELAK